MRALYISHKSPTARPIAEPPTGPSNIAADTTSSSSGRRLSPTIILVFKA
jgi:hypothetical protein